MAELIAALRDNWEGHEMLQAMAQVPGPQVRPGRRRRPTRWPERSWTSGPSETWKHRTKSTGRQFRPGMLSWNYWAGDGLHHGASADGRPKGQFLSNAICPSNGADINGPTANANSVGKVLGGKARRGKGDWEDYLNSLPNGASHTITFNPSILRDPEHREKFKAFLRGYAETAAPPSDQHAGSGHAPRRPEASPELPAPLVRITGYNAYFTTMGKELQDEVIERISHGRC